MATFSEYTEAYKKLKKKQEEEEARKKVQSFAQYTESANDDIAPVKTTTSEEEEEEDTYFQKSSFFDDGYQFGDVTKTIGATLGDVGENIVKGGGEFLEKLWDGMQTLGTANARGSTPSAIQGQILYNALKGNDKEVAALRDLQRELPDQIEKGVAEYVAKDLIQTDKVDFGVDEYSVLGEKSDALVQSATDVGIRMGISAIPYVGVPLSYAATGLTVMGGEAENAFNQGATFEEAVMSGMISAGAEMGTEALFGGIKLGGKALSDAAASKIASTISNKFVGTLAKWGFNAAGEGVEEVLSGLLSAAGQKITYADEKEFNELFSSEDAWDNFVGGVVLGGFFDGVNIATAKAKGIDYVSRLKLDEKKVVDKVYKDEVAAEEKAKGRKLTAREKTKIFDKVIEQAEKGYISTDTIEEVLDGDNYKVYQDTLAKEKELQKEYEELYNMKNGDKSDAQIARQADLHMQLGEIKTFKEGYQSDAFNRVKDGRLSESYRERARRSEKYEADLSQYDTKQAEVIRKAVESGILNNTRRTHEFVDMVAKISADKGVLFDFTNNEKLKKSGFAIEGRTVNGFVTKDGVTVNINAAKSLNSVVGHEITHVLEGTELYTELQKALFKYAESKGDYKGRHDTLTELYKNIEGADVDAELTADLIGDYLFTDTDFINNLSTKHRNVFEKIYDEIKYLLKVATSGSKEALELEKVKRAFEKAYRENGKSESDAKGDTKYSLTAEQEAYFKDSVVRDDHGKNLSEEQKKFFKDSKVIDADTGGLMVLYHGSRNPLFTEFNTGTGVWLTPSQSYAEIYAEMWHSWRDDFADEPLEDRHLTGIEGEVYADQDYRLYKMYANIVNPLDLGEINADLTSREIAKLARMVSVPKAEIQDIIDIYGCYEVFEVTRTEEFIDMAREKGYDGFSATEDGRLTFCAFNAANQVKLTTNENPTSNHDIRYSLSDSEGNTLTKEQSEYFKDSKARDRDGNLLKVYHTTNSDFTVFDKSKKGEATGADNTYLGFFFADDAEYMQSFPEFENGKTEAYYLNMTNPIDMTNISKEAFLDVVEVLGGDVDEAAEVYDQELLDERDRAMLRGGNNTSLQLNNLIESVSGEYFSYYDFIEELKPHYDELMSKGYDGVVNYLDEMLGAKEYIVLDSNQAKLTTNTNPTADPDVRYSLSSIASSFEGEAPIKRRMNNVYGEDIALEQDIAPVSEMVDESVDESVTGTNAEDIAPIVETDDTITEGASDPVTEVETEHPIKTTKEKLNEKNINLHAELENIEKHRADATKSYDEKIAKAQAQLDSKKNKDSKVANRLKMRIERLNRLKADIDAKYAERIRNINKRIDKTDAELEKDHTEKDRYAEAKARIERILESDKAALVEEYEQRKAELRSKTADKNAYISNMARELYDELRGLRKGVRASADLGSLLDVVGPDWSNLRSALSNVRYNPSRTVIQDSAEESAVRQLIDESYESDVYEIDDLDTELAEKINKLETEAETEKQNARRATNRRMKSKEYTEMWKNLLGDTSTWKDMALGLQYKTKTLRRILRKVVRGADGKANIELADRIYDELETKYDHNEALLKRESHTLKESFAKLKLNHKEDTYAQMLGEFRHNPDTTITQDALDEYYQKNKGKIDTAKVDKAIEESRKLYDDLFERVNEVLREQGFKEIPYRQGYFPHFTNPKQNWFQKAINWKPINTEIPTSIAGLTEAFKPQRSWQGFDKQRYGDDTDYSLYQGLDTYIHGALDWIYHIEDLQKRRELENYLRYIHSDAGVQEEIQKIKDSNLDADQAQIQIDAVLKEARNPLSGLVRELMNRTNTLANKKAAADRGMEDDLNRKIYSTMTNLNNRINANMVVGSISSALTNFIPITQSWHQVSPYFTVRGLGDFVRSTIHDDGMIAKSDFLTNRLMEEENLYKTGWDKVSNAASFLMGAFDSISAQTVWRSKYLQDIKEGMSEGEAIRDADQFAKNVMAGRSRGNAPTIFDAKNPMTKLFTAFQLEVANQYGYMFDDAVKDSTSKARLVKGYATAFVGAYLYNALYSTLTGRDAAFDPIRIIQELIGDLADDDEEPEDVVLNFADNIVDEIPFVSGLTGGGRIPMSSALPYGNESAPFESIVTDIADGNWESMGKELLTPLYYLAMPVGGGQFKKTVEGLSMFSDEHPIAGSYTDSGALRFPVEENFGNVLQSALFGQYASRNARDYFDSGAAPLEEKQIQEFIDVEMPIQDYWKYREGLSGLKTLAEKADYIDSLKLSDRQKNILINNLADRKEDIDMSDYGNYGSFEEFDYAIKNPEKYAFLKESGLSYDAYNALDDDGKDAYDWAFRNPSKYEVAKAVSDDLLTYYKYRGDLNDIRADKDASGKTISGSRKEKVIKYINNLNADYGEKIILLKSEYPSDDTYNYEIIDYLNSRDDISYEEMETILKELGFTVDSHGNISW